MTILPYVADFFAGLFLCNCIPHLACGLRGEPFPTPFAKPRGIGHSSSLLNFLWGSLNLLIGGSLLSSFPILPGFHLAFILFATGFLLTGAYAARHFEAGRLKKRNE